MLCFLGLTITRGTRCSYLGGGGIPHARVESWERSRFRGDVPAAIIDGTAHRPTCLALANPLAAHTIRLPDHGVYASHRCPCERPRCRPLFEALLS